ncbi:MAG: AtpZ/AtpI family protein [Vicinamibacterales bacterium]
MTAVPSANGTGRRPDLRARLARDLDRHARREPGEASFWRSLSVLGAVGWPIVLSAVGGALLGRFLDARVGAGGSYTLPLLLAGVAAGTAIAWHLVRPERR